MRLPITVLLFLIASCGSETTRPRLEDLGLMCDASHPCPAGTECGTCGVGTGQCVAPCSASGPGSDGAECPSGSFCSRAWSDTEVHVCVRACVRDADCATPTGNAGLSCNDPYLDPGTQANDVAICNVSNSIGGSSKCSDVPR